MTIGKKIAKARGDMKANELAKLVGVDAVTLSRWENDETDIKLKDFIKIVQVLNKSADEVLFDEGSEYALRRANSLIAGLDLRKIKAIVTLLNGNH